MITLRKDCVARPAARPVIRVPPEVPLPDLPVLGWNQVPVFPAIMVQWCWGVQAYWSDEEAVFTVQRRNKAPQDSSGPLIQVRVDGIELSLGRKDLAWGWFWARSANNNRDEIHRQITENDPADDLEFWLADYDMAGSGAAGRSYYVVNTARQDRLKIPQVYQVIDAAGYNDTLDRWKVAGSAGAIVQEMNAPFSDPHLLTDFFMKAGSGTDPEGTLHSSS